MPLLGANMNLREYLFVHRLSVKEFSETLGYSRTHLSAIVHGKFKPSKKLAQYIEKMTNGEVKVEDLMKGE